MNRTEALLVAAILMASFVGSAFADSVVTAPNGCNTKCQVNSLETPYVTGNFTVVFPISSNELAGILATGSISNFGTRTAYNVHRWKHWTSYLQCSAEARRL